MRRALFRLMILGWLRRDAAGFFDRLQRLDWYADAMARWVDGVPVRRGDRVLDVGCGPGHVARMLVGRGARVTAVDRSAAMVARARANASGCEVRRGDALALPLEDESQDVVLAASLVNVVSERRALLVELRRVTSVGGKVSLLVPTPAFARQVPALIAEGQLGSFSAAAMQTWSRRAPRMEPEEVLELMAEAGLDALRSQELLRGGVVGITGTRG